MSAPFVKWTSTGEMVDHTFDRLRHALGDRGHAPCAEADPGCRTTRHRKRPQR